MAALTMSEHFYIALRAQQFEYLEPLFLACGVDTMGDKFLL